VRAREIPGPPRERESARDASAVHGYLAQKEAHHPWTLQQAYSYGPTVVAVVWGEGDAVCEGFRVPGEGSSRHGLRVGIEGFLQDSGAEARRVLRGNSGCRVACCVFRVSGDAGSGGGEAHLAAVASAFSLTDSGFRT